MGNNHLYINGCSFTKGHNLPEEQSWPFLLQKELSLSQKYENKSWNANSLGTIVKKSMFDLRNCPKNTLAVIGLTWPTRYSLLIDNFFLNGGPALYIDKANPQLNRIVPLYDVINKQEYLKLIDNNKDKLQVIKKYSDFLNSLCKYDDNFIENQYFENFIKLKSFESYLKSQNIDYIFIEFQNSLKLEDKLTEIDKFFEFDSKKIMTIYFDKKEMIEAHPSQQQCIVIKDQIIKKIEKLYPKYIKSKQLNLF
jgi:hypothetical protein